MEPLEQSIPRRRGLRPEMFVAVFAILISLSTLVVYIYQSNLMRQQQTMSVWPYLVFGPSWGPDYLRISVTNKGVGPAIVRSVRCEYDDRPLADLHEIMSLLPDSLATDYRYSSIWPGQVLMAGEDLVMLEVVNPATVAHLLERFRTEQIVYEICYASIYGETWTSFGTGVRAGDCGE
jgi:hypothetical protein